MELFLPHSGTLRVYEDAEGASSGRRTGSLPRSGETEPSVAQGPGDYRRGGPGDLGRFTRGKAWRKTAARYGVYFYAGRQRAHRGLDAVPLPAAVR